MICSDARLTANRMNAARSTGPKTAEGKERSRRNGLKHGLTGEGIVVPEGDQEEIERRVEAFEADMKPKSPVGVAMIMQMATLSVRAERAGKQESAAISSRVRNACETFDQERIDQADQLFDELGEDPRRNLRKLRRSPEGVERLLDAWHDLRDDLAREGRGSWTAAHLEQAANMTGAKVENARSSRIGALSRGFWGDFHALADSEGGELGEEARQDWARARLIERIDAEIAGLEAHYETLDFETIALDRLEAPDRALFDPSKEATLARRYESEARRGFFKALKEFRQVEAESAACAESSPTRPPAAKVGSSWESGSPPDREPSRPYPDASFPESPVVRGDNGQPLVYGRPAKTPG